MERLRSPLLVGGALASFAGFLVLVLGWRGVAATLAAERQTPYLFSAGLVGLGLILVGALLINLYSQRLQSRTRDRELQLVTGTLNEVRARLAGEPPPNPNEA